MEKPPKGPENLEHDHLAEALKEAEDTLSQLKKERDELVALRGEVIDYRIAVQEGTLVLPPDRVQYFDDQLRDLTFEIGKYNVGIEQSEKKLKESRAIKASHDAIMKKPGGAVN